MPFAGGPSAFSLPSTSGFPGFNEGFTDFAATPVSGTYTLNVTIPVSPGTAQKPFTYTKQGDAQCQKGAADLHRTEHRRQRRRQRDRRVDVPQRRDRSVCRVFRRRLELHVVLPKTPGTQRLPAGTIGSCTAFEVEAVGFDYPAAFEANGGNNRSQTPNDRRRRGSGRHHRFGTILRDDGAFVRIELLALLANAELTGRAPGFSTRRGPAFRFTGEALLTRPEGRLDELRCVAFVGGDRYRTFVETLGGGFGHSLNVGVKVIARVALNCRSRERSARTAG